MARTRGKVEAMTSRKPDGQSEAWLGATTAPLRPPLDPAQAAAEADVQAGKAGKGGSGADAVWRFLSCTCTSRCRLPHSRLAALLLQLAVQRTANQNDSGKRGENCLLYHKVARSLPADTGDLKALCSSNPSFVPEPPPLRPIATVAGGGRRDGAGESRTAGVPRWPTVGCNADARRP